MRNSLVIFNEKGMVLTEKINSSNKPECWILEYKKKRMVFIHKPKLDFNYLKSELETARV